MVRFSLHPLRPVAVLVVIPVSLDKTYPLSTLSRSLLGRFGLKLLGRPTRIKWEVPYSPPVKPW